ncbi:DNA polymerase beta superfamily protein [Nonomuraea sp. CA-143628]|uniref:DNA polymerase beta superfamily protein n=1 Tax=Nonomuraea sp. CA-143628 TaxID=3239997 RepID=UPI003D912642
MLTPEGGRLRDLRGAFLSRRAHESFTRYADAQFRRLDPAAPKWKQAMHLIRLLLSGRHLVRHGEPLIQVGDHRDRLLAIKRGEVPWAEIAAWRAELTGDLADAAGVLPAAPDRASVETYLVAVRRAHLSRERV